MTDSLTDTITSRASCDAKNAIIYMSESQLVVSFESQSWVNLKVVKRWRKKLNEHNIMSIYHHKQCETLQKHLANFSDFSVEMIQKVPKICKRKNLFHNWFVSESWRPADSENVMALYAFIVKCWVAAKKKYQNWYTIDALGAIFAIFTIVVQ